MLIYLPINTLFVQKSPWELLVSLFTPLVLQECMGEYNDWRKCQKEVKVFRQCIEESKKKKQ